MYTTTDETGRLNNYATEPPVYFSTFPSPEQQRRYVIQGGLAMLLVCSVLLVALYVS
ncbi:MAG: ssl1498 family light-harvesting-like protein [Phormidesmis sp. RL_2_1]|nr:ssl1498 family light-harvesting-like protein [Phormidesmis sp. RL_2_1]